MTNDVLSNEAATFAEEEIKTVYGYSVYAVSNDDESRATITLSIELTEGEYLQSVIDLEEIMTIADMADHVQDLDSVFRSLVESVSLVETNAAIDLGAIRKSVEDFIETVPCLVSQFKRLFSNSEDISSDLDVGIAELYDHSESYALINKLRNVLQHESRLPIKVNREIDKDGKTRASITLDSNAILDSHASHYLNRKVMDYLRMDAEPDLLFHSFFVYERVSILFSNALSSYAHDGERMRKCASFIETLAELHANCSSVWLVKIVIPAGADKRKIQTSRRYLPLEYFCKLLSGYLSSFEEMLYSYWGDTVDKSLQCCLPGLVGKIHPGMRDTCSTVEFEGVIYYEEKQQLQMDEGSSQLLSIFSRRDSQAPLDLEILDRLWNQYRVLVRGLAALSEANANPSY